MARDLMHSDEIKAIVRSAYSSIDKETTEVALKVYAPEELAQGPAGRRGSRARRGQPPSVRRDHARRDDPRPGLWRRDRHDLAAQRTGPAGR